MLVNVPLSDSGFFLSILVELSCEKEGDKNKRIASKRRTQEGGPGFERVQVQHVFGIPVPS
jgi:hypothetical protein